MNFEKFSQEDDARTQSFEDDVFVTLHPPGQKHDHLQRSMRRRRRLYSTLAHVFLLAMILALLIVFGAMLSTALTMRTGRPNNNAVVQLKQHSSGPEVQFDYSDAKNLIWEDCGRTADEARTRGCCFDVLLVAWVRPECFDSELMESYLAEDKWPFWLNWGVEQERPVSLEQVRLGLFDTVYSTSEFHLAHCAYFLEQSVRGFRGWTRIDNVTLDIDHTKHCARSLKDQWLPPMGFSPLHMDWHSCGRIRT